MATSGEWTIRRASKLGIFYFRCFCIVCYSEDISFYNFIHVICYGMSLYDKVFYWIYRYNHHLT